jgi:hypothetical protein
LLFPSSFAAEVVDIVNSPYLWGEVGALLSIIEPIAGVIVAIQGATATLSDVMRYWCRLGVDMGRAVAKLEMPEGAPLVGAFEHVGQVYARRVSEFATPAARLAFFLDPRFKIATRVPTDGTSDVCKVLREFVSIYGSRF